MPTVRKTKYFGAHVGVDNVAYHDISKRAKVVMFHQEVTE